jgi:cytochrome c-type biogenesis protein CcmH/NrfG
MRNLPLLQAQLEREPENIFNWTHLGRVLKGLGRLDEAEEAFEHAAALAREHWDEHGGVAFVELLDVRVERGDDVAELLAEARSRWPDNWSLVWLEGHLQLAAGRDEEAAATFTALTQVDVAAPSRVSYAPRLFGPDTHAALGLALFRLGRYDGAAAAYAAAEQLAPDVAEYRVKRLLAESRAAARAQSPS